MKKTHIIFILIIAVAIAAIIGTVADSSTYESFAAALENPETDYHVVGKLNKKAPLVYNPQLDANRFEFTMIDNEGTEKKVIYSNTKPQDFEKSEQIVVVGKCKDDAFYANQILMKCPSKYNDGSQQMVEAQ
jgi:cytochrome c-type biogenesis protein CcmE